ncbi:hypothetical protein DPMN_043547 [Dreissena polymorpha]|uniref:Uncharacterized protein n=1 Tax=Dreissena polymorpha TaxID=45954 RepID=A0A9D4D2Y0_DREPO|nr:hypothetical protein DPMN_043547 [Dreissena polymorpha]
MGRDHKPWDFTALRAYCRENEYSRRRLIQNSGQTQLDVGSSNLSVYRYSVRQAYNRPVCELPKHPAPKIQQSILGISFREGGCVGTEQLGARKQLCERFILFDTSGARCNTDAKAFAVKAPLWKAQTWFRRLYTMSIAPPLQIPNSPRAFRAMGPVPEPCRNRPWKVYARRIYGGKV